MRRLTRGRRRRAQSTVEFAITYVTLFFPLTMMIIFTAQLLWVWHSVVDFTREGARYAATHCYQGSGANVVNYMQENAPLMVDRDEFRGGEAEIVVSYFSRDPDSGALAEFACEGGDCTRDCVPDVVRVGINNYQFRQFVSYLGLPPVPIPNFSATVAVQSAGCGPDSEDCVP
ncbi:MAG: pilus assembly protein [Bryobacteraceae bacterium]